MIAVYGQRVSDVFFPYLKKILSGLKEKGFVLVCEEQFALFLKAHAQVSDLFQDCFNEHDLSEKGASILLSIGGDGTFLRSVHFVKNSGIPILGLNDGRMGFLANVSVADIDAAIHHIYTGDYRIEERDVLRLHLNGSGFTGFNYGLNEISIQKSNFSSLLTIHVNVDGVYLTTYWADGLLVATPTGSTAYSLSGGGPIVSPNCRNLILTPLNPHNLSMRALVLPADVKVELQVESRSKEYILTLDSRSERMSDEVSVGISTGEFKVKVVQFPEHNFFRILRDKLGWGEDIRNREA